jgi:hypothetical protein
VWDQSYLLRFVALQERKYLFCLATSTVLEEDLGSSGNKSSVVAFEHFFSIYGEEIMQERPGVGC